MLWIIRSGTVKGQVPNQCVLVASDLWAPSHCISPRIHPSTQPMGLPCSSSHSDFLVFPEVRWGPLTCNTPGSLTDLLHPVHLPDCPPTGEVGSAGVLPPVSSERCMPVATSSAAWPCEPLSDLSPNIVYLVASDLPLGYKTTVAKRPSLR